MTASISIDVIGLFNFLSDLDVTLVTGTYQENYLFLLDFPNWWSTNFKSISL